MIQANVAAAEALEAKRAPVIYRVHDAPSKEKLVALREFLESLDLKLPGAGDAARRATSTSVLQRAKTLPVADLVNEVVLRSQSQAVYAAENIGHFGLNLQPLRALHLADPALRRPDRASLADPRAGPRRRRHRRRGGRSAQGHRAGDLRHRAPRHGGRARDRRPADRRLPRRPGRRRVRRAHLRRHALRPVRAPQRHRRRRLRAGRHHRRRLLPPRRGPRTR